MSDLICGDVPVESSCRCSLPPDHDGDHACGRIDCGGTWRYVDGQWEPVTWPGVRGIVSTALVLLDDAE